MHTIEVEFIEAVDLRCVDCLTPTPEGQKFCGNCGSAVVQRPPVVRAVVLVVRNDAGDCVAELELPVQQ